ncbi:MAG: hypothetical protein HY038_05090 [Nitrospirae bacterium]|nr:hypothetical protein [Nitrospirota bacterium]
MITHEEKNNWNPRAAVLVLAVGIGMMVSLAPGSARADQGQQLPIMTVGYQSGTITAIYETTFLIDGRTFSLTPDAIVQDDTGKEVGTGALVVTAEVKYHLKKDQNDKIDRMVVYLPR